MVRKSASLAQQAANEILSGIRSGQLAKRDGVLPSEADPVDAEHRPRLVLTSFLLARLTARRRSDTSFRVK
jgi:hypothetical protein